MDSLAVGLGRKWNAAASVDVVFVRSFKATKNSYLAATTGTEGFGIAANVAGAKASVRINDFYEPLTLAPDFDTFDVATSTNSFAVGLNGALKISNDVVGNPVSYEIPATIADVRELGEDAYDQLKLTIVMITDDGNLVQLQFPETSMALDGKSVNFSESGIEVTFRSLYDGSTCTPYTIKHLPQLRDCIKAAP
jgi:hypothetical protein